MKDLNGRRAKDGASNKCYGDFVVHILGTFPQFVVGE
jgi:hypothetical protein